MKNNIILIGFMGCGKTSIGTRLAKKLSYTFLDTDALIIEKAGQSISEIFESDGEEYFRNLETDILKELNVKTDRAVISTGGGMPMREENKELLRSLGHVIFLDASKDAILKRVEGDTKRPLLAYENKEERIQELLSIRLPFYKSCAHMVIDTSDKSFYDVINEIEQCMDNSFKVV